MSDSLELIQPSTELDNVPVYIVGQIRAICESPEGWHGETTAWEFVGVFGSKEQAEKACRDYTYFAMGPMPIGYAFPHETVGLEAMPAWFPIARTKADPLLPGESAWRIEPVTANT